MRDGASPHFLLECREFRTRWTNSMACSLPWFKSLTFFFSGDTGRLLFILHNSATSTTCNNEHRRNWDIRTRPEIFLSVRQSLFRHATYCVKLKVDSLRAAFHLQKAAIRKPCFRMSVFIKHIFILLCLRTLSTGLAILFVHPVYYSIQYIRRLFWK